MLRIFDKYSPNANPANTSYPNGSGKDESVSGANDGTPLEMDWYNDMLGYSEALLAEAGIDPSGAADTALTSDRMTAFRIAAIRVETAVAYNGGDVSRVGVIALVTGDDVTDYDYIVDGPSLTRWSVGTVTGTFAGDFNASTGVDSGLSGALVQVEAITENRVSSIESDVLTNLSKIIGEGQTWQDVTASRFSGILYTNTETRPIVVGTRLNANSTISAEINSVDIGVYQDTGASASGYNFIIIPPLQTYKFTVTLGSIQKWLELKA